MTSYLRTSVIAFSLATQTLAAASVPSDVVARLAKSAARFWEQFSAITCTEMVEQQKLTPEGKTLVQKKLTFDYLMLLQVAGDEMIVEESRILQGKEPKASDRALLTTNGFATLLLVFHPLFQSSYDFSDLGDDEWNGKTYARIAFEHIKGKRSPTVLQLHGRDFPIEWKGTAWVDPASASIARMQVDLKAPMTDVGLLKLSSDVQYARIPIRGEQEGAWMPQTAVVEAATLRQRWRNTHQYTKYRQFEVSTDSKTEAPKEK